MKNRYKKMIFSLAAILFILFPQVFLAQGLKDAFGSGSPLVDVKDRAGYGEEDIGTISGRVINTALTIVGVIFLLLMVYAGYLWMTAQGEDAQIKKATDIIKGTVIGLVLVLSAYAITIFVTKGLNPSSSSGGVCVDTSPNPVPPCSAGACAAYNDQTACINDSCCAWGL